MSVFAKYESKSYPFRFEATLLVTDIAGGIPSDPNVIEGWLRTKIADKDDLIRQAVAETMIERGVGAEEATELVAKNKHLNGFKRDEKGLYIEGRQVKAAIKEAANVARAVGKLPDKWGLTRKGIDGFVAEHIMVVEDRVYLGVERPDDVLLSFPKGRFGPSVQYTEIVSQAKVGFTVIADYDFTAEQWAMLWLTGQQQGLGAMRSQGHGRYEVVTWNKQR